MFSIFTTGADCLLSDDDFDIFDAELGITREQLVNQEKAEEERRELERRDEAFARLLQNNSTPPSNTPSSSNTNMSRAPSAFDRMSGMRPMQSTFPGAPSQFLNSSARNSSARPSAVVKNKYNAGHIKQQPGVKAESSSSFSMPGAYRDDSSSAGDSDIEIIPASSFRDNGRRTHSSAGLGTQYLSPSSPAAQVAGEAALRRVGQTSSNASLQMALFGKSSQPKWAQASPSQSNPPSTNLPSSTSMGGSYVYPNASMANVPSYSGGGPFGSTNSVHTGPYAGAYTGVAGPVLSYTLNNAPGMTMVNGHNIFVQPTTLGGYASATQQPNYMSSQANRGGWDMPHEEGMADYYTIHDQKNTIEELKALMDNIRSDEDLPEDREGTPDGLKAPLVSIEFSGVS